MLVSFDVICVDDTNRPAAVQPQNWVKKDRIYAVTRVQISLNGDIALVLAQRTPDAPYVGYLARRFRPVLDVPLDELIADLESPPQYESAPARPVRVPDRELVEARRY